MTAQVPEFWQLLVQSQLLSPADCQRLGYEFGQVKGAAVQGNARTLSEWLISRNILSRYQATILLGGRAGPFIYGDYTIYDRPAQGPLAGMFKAVHAPSGHPVVLQFIAGDALTDPAKWKQIVERVEKLKTISHPLLNRCFELCDLGQFKFIVLDDPPGLNLQERLATAGRLAPEEAVRTAWHAAQALEQLHKAGIAHGDVRPANLFLAQANRTVLWKNVAEAPLTFDALRADANFTARVEYLAPEMVQPGKTPDPLVDIYALGCSLYEMLTGRVPFAGSDPNDKLRRHATEPIQPLEQLGIRPELAKAVAYMMAKNPAVRYPQASVAVEQLAPLLSPADRQGRPISAPPTMLAMDQFLRSKPKAQPKPQQPQAAPSAAGSAAPGQVRPVAVAAAGVAPVAVASSAGVKKSSNPIAEQPLASRYKEKKPLTKNTPLLVTLLGGIGFLILVGALWGSGALGGGDAPEVAVNTPAEETPPITSTNNGTTPPVDENPSGVTPPVDDPNSAGPAAKFNIVTQDDGKSLYASTTTGQPIDLAYAPSDAKAYFVFRPADILTSGRGQEILRTLGPDFAALKQRWEKSAGVTLDEVERLIVGVHSTGGMMPRFSTTVQLKSPVDMKQRWGNPAPAGSPDQFSVSGWSAWLPPDGGGRVFVLGSKEEIDPLVQAGAAKPRPILTREFAHLLKSSDEQRHVTLLFDPHFFRSDGRKMFTGQFAKLVDPIDEFFGDYVKGMLSLHFGDEFYGEARMYAGLERPPADLQEEFQGKLQDYPQQIRKYVVSLNAPDYWKQLWFNYPQMITFMASNLRLGVEENTAIINFRVPGKVAPNLLAASELAIASQPGATYAGGPSTTTSPPKSGPKTMDELLASPFDLSFDQQSLEFAMADLAKGLRDQHGELPFPFDIRIIGPDLQMDGITRNQQVRDFKAEKTPVSEVLTRIVMKANPVTTVKEPSEADQKLIWVVGPDPDNASRQIVLITTRAAAAKKNYTLPKPFQPK